MKYVTGAKKNDNVTENEKKAKTVAYQAALESIVLLSNDGSLPLKKKKVALYGAGGLYTIKGGTGSGEVNERHSTTIYEGLIERGFEVSNKTWIEDYKKTYEEKREEYLKTVKFNLFHAVEIIMSMNASFVAPNGREITPNDVKESDTENAIYVVSRQAGEGGDKKIENGEFDLTKEEKDTLEFLVKNYKHVIFVVNTGSAMDISIVDKFKPSAVIYYCQQGQEGGYALADILSGEASPSGKLTSTWVKKYEDIPFANEYSYRSGDIVKGTINNELYKEGIYVGYRYFDTYEVEPRYHFGFGLTYSSFDLSFVSLDYKNNQIDFVCKIKNTGKVNAKNVAQLYVSCPDGKLAKEYQRLVGFKKSKLLKPSEEETLKISFDISYLASYSEETSSYILEPGNYLFRLGDASNNTELVAAISLDKEVVLQECKSIVNKNVEFEEIVPVVRENNEKLDDIKIVSLKAKDIKTTKFTYNVPEIYHDKEVDEILSKLSVKDMATICVGCGLGAGLLNSCIYTPGAVGRTTDKYVSKGLINVNLCDGPAGIRILRRSTVQKSGKAKYIDSPMALFEFMPKWIKKFSHGNVDKDEILYQNCTAYPVGTALAQTFNTDLCERVGECVSQEMEDYLVTYWLAPAQNIHRNPLCGRNFEYLSEDPVLTGKISSAITKGVQSIDGNYVTIKHLCCNNQEDNRMFSNSCVNERALREIYLKGFEINIREAHAKAVMTSYNLINGIYAPNHNGIVTDALKNEWGFDGVVMTDWYSTKKGQGTAPGCMKAGNDLIMPGQKVHIDEIVNAVKNGEISIEDLRRCCANVVRLTLQSSVNKKYSAKDFSR